MLSAMALSMWIAMTMERETSLIRKKIPLIGTKKSLLQMAKT